MQPASALAVQVLVYSTVIKLRPLAMLTSKGARFTNMTSTANTTSLLLYTFDAIGIHKPGGLSRTHISCVIKANDGQGIPDYVNRIRNFLLRLARRSFL